MKRTTCRGHGGQTVGDNRTDIPFPIRGCPSSVLPSPQGPVQEAVSRGREGASGMGTSGPASVGKRHLQVRRVDVVPSGVVQSWPVFGASRSERLPTGYLRATKAPQCLMNSRLAP